MGRIRRWPEWRARWRRTASTGRTRSTSLRGTRLRALLAQWDRGAASMEDPRLRVRRSGTRPLRSSRHRGLLGGHAFEHNPRCYVLDVTDGWLGRRRATSDDRVPRCRRGWGALAVAAGSSCSFVGILLARSGGPIEADTTEHVKLNTVFGPLATSPKRSSRRFTARADGSRRSRCASAPSGGVIPVQGERATHVGRRPRSLRASSLRIARAGQRTVRGAAVRAARAAATAATTSSTCRSSEAGGESVVVWAGTEPDGLLPPARFGADTLPVSAELHTSYGGDHRAWDQIALALRRLEQYRPWFQHRAVVIVAAAVAVAALVLLVVARGRRAVALLIVLVVAKGAALGRVVPPARGP